MESELPDRVHLTALANGKLEAWNKTIKRTTIRPSCPGSKGEARELITGFVKHYNFHRLHSAIGYVTPYDMLMGRADEIWATRDRKLEAARERRRAQQSAIPTPVPPAVHSPRL